ncbi:type II toxin-antitoxin system mRNA interferase toxin, RelE/StbE family [Ligilactobacillus animalis]|jgi:mRNA interferase YafQ|uniref:type II toxin-antitoxin system RelE/ParE family toxin n=1 Tax=Ligilactobacillus animalis TaxID=1605 RepID=UPI0010CA38F9|nr:type II toxin-antitoxin system mRNA interferase toxin, RelE/StbE family [Ligilactobacillus animalis]QCQ04871.1 type II toxin-antitoxin system mRNA interferase toxin, RelE/StbE family [Ligilactobacillus animalis]
MFSVIFEPQFLTDYRNIKKQHPEISRELTAALTELKMTGTVPLVYKPHYLNTPNENYSGYYEFHLADGKFDVLVIYLPHKSKPKIRLIRMGSHHELFQGPLK